jgi:ATP-dependent helicase HrpA
VLRYVRGIERRLAKVPDDVHRDRARMAEVHAIEQRVGALADRYSDQVTPPEVLALPWLVEELRVHQFAQMVGTRGSVSLAKVSRELARLGG